MVVETIYSFHICDVENCYQVKLLINMTPNIMVYTIPSLHIPKMPNRGSMVHFAKLTRENNICSDVLTAHNARSMTDERYQMLDYS